MGGWDIHLSIFILHWVRVAPWGRQIGTHTHTHTLFCCGYACKWNEQTSKLREKLSDSLVLEMGGHQLPQEHWLSASLWVCTSSSVNCSLPHFLPCSCYSCIDYIWPLCPDLARPTQTSPWAGPIIASPCLPGLRPFAHTAGWPSATPNLKIQHFPPT